MINKLLMGLIKLITSIVSLLLTPINNLITELIPDLSKYFSVIENLFNLLFTYVGWFVDALMINTETISLIIIVLTARLTLPLIISTTKLAIKWYNQLKP